MNRPYCCFYTVFAPPFILTLSTISTNSLAKKLKPYAPEDTYYCTPCANRFSPPGAKYRDYHIIAHLRSLSQSPFWRKTTKIYCYFRSPNCISSNYFFGFLRISPIYFFGFFQKWANYLFGFFHFSAIYLFG